MTTKTCLAASILVAVLSLGRPGQAQEAPPAPAEPTPAVAPPSGDGVGVGVGEAVAEPPAPGPLEATATAVSTEAMEPTDLQPRLRAAIEALVVGDFVAARAGIAALRQELPAEHWMQESLVGLGKVADQMESQLALKCPELGRDDESIASLYTTSTIFGFYTGVYLFGILGNLDVQATVPLSVVTAAAGLGGAYLLDKREFLTGPVADGIAGGMLIGAGETALIVAAMADNDPSEELAFGLIWGGALLGAVVGGAVTDATGATRGDVALTTSGYSWGLATGLFASLIIDYDEFEPFLWTVAGGGAAGLALGAGLASRYDMSPSRVLYINLGGLGGALVGLGVAVGAEMDSPQAVGVTLGLTYLGGLVVGGYLTRNLDAEAPGLSFQAMPTVIPSLDRLRRPAPGMALNLTW